MGKPPVRVGVCRLELTPPPLMLPKWYAFFSGLKNHLDEPVVPELLQARQIRVHLGLETNRLKFAMLSAGDYAEVSKDDTHRIIAVPINQHNQTYRRGLIVVAPKSEIQSLSELKKKRFHFMLQGDPLNDAAMGALLEAGLSKDDIDQGILGLGLDTHHISSLESAKSVVLEGNVAGVIDEADYEKWPEKGGSFVLLSPSKEQVRVIAKTVKVPEGPIVASVHTPTEMVEKVQDYLFNKLAKKGLLEEGPLVLGILGYKGFAEPIDPQEYEPFSQIYRKLHPGPVYAEPVEPDEDSATSEPADSAPKAE